MSQPGDALGNTTSISGSKADEYYAWKLMADRMAVWTDPRFAGNPQAQAILGSVSQREAIKHRILGKLVGPEYAESTAKYAQLVRFTEGRKSKLDQAEFLADKVFESLEAKAVLNELVGNPDGKAFKDAMDAPSAQVGGAGIAQILSDAAAFFKNE